MSFKPDSNDLATQKLESNGSDSVPSSKMPLRDGRTSKPGSYAGSPSGHPETVPEASNRSGTDPDQSSDEADRGKSSRQTSEAEDEAGQA